MSEPRKEVLADGIEIWLGDCLEVVRGLADNSIDSVCTDPPYALVSVVQRFANSPRSETTENQANPYGRTGRGFMGKKWDTGETAFAVEFWAQILRVLKPGGHVAAFGGTRSYHRLACAIEDAGFEIRDQLAWCYGTGFPKSHDVSKGIDKAAGVAREIVAQGAPVKRMIPGADQNRQGWEKNNGREYVPTETAAATDAAKQWEGWGTALKPAWEPICLARKPLSEKTVAANVLRWGTGAINVGACKIETDTPRASRVKIGGASNGIYGDGLNNSRAIEDTTLGRWPANLCHDGSDEVLAAFPESAGQLADVSLDAPSAKTGNVYGKMNRHGEKSADSRYQDKGSTNFAALPGMRRNNSGSAARFFYSAKASKADRAGSKHPTVKPVKLMQWLVRLLTPPGGTVLDPFAGTGTTGAAAFHEGFSAILIEREAEYQHDIRRRLSLVLEPDDEPSQPRLAFDEPVKVKQESLL